MGVSAASSSLNSFRGGTARRLTSHMAVSPFLFLLSPIVGIGGSLIAMASSLVIDADHIHLVIKERAFSLKKLKELNKGIFDKNRYYENVTYALHSLEVSLVLLCLSFFWSPLNYVAIGFLFHIVADAIHHRIHKLPVLSWLFLHRLGKLSHRCRNNQTP